MWTLVILSLAIVSAAAQSSNCVPGAEPDGNGGCVCSAGKSGNPDLCCYDNSFRGCHVAGDPVLSSFVGQKIGLDFPCGTMISSSQANPDEAVVNVFVAGKELSGTYYTSHVKVQIRQFGSTTTLSFHFDDVASEGQIETAKDNGVEDLVRLSDNQPMALSGFSSNIMVEFLKDAHIFVVKVAGLELNIRPSTGNNVQQKYTPGVCVMEPQGSLAASPGSNYACSLDRDVTTLPLGDFLNYAIRPMKNYMFNNGILKLTTSPDFLQQCNSFQDTMISKCAASDRDNALKKCLFLGFQPVVRRCLSEAGQGYDAVFQATLQCLETYCTGDSNQCDNLKADLGFSQCAPSLMDCETWPPYRRENSFVAGEGDGEFLGGGGENEGGNNEGGAASTPFNFDIFGNGDNSDNDNGAGGVGGFVPPQF